MSVNLQKGQQTVLENGGGAVKTVVMGLGWDEAPKRFLIFGKNKQIDIDCDATALLLDAQSGKLAAPDDVVYYGNLTHSCGAVRHLGDNLTGAGAGDDEQIVIDLEKIPEKYGKIVIVVNIYQEEGQKPIHFGMLQNAFVRVLDADSGEEICKFDLAENYSGKTAVIFGELARDGGKWTFTALGEPTDDSSISEVAARFQ